ncbi:MAG: VOC family protein [Cyanobacteria bacterium P01_G01_bin.38]
MKTTQQKIVTSLWFDDNAEEAINFYLSIFNNSRILSLQRYGKAGLGPEGSIMTISFELEDQKFLAINGGPAFKFTEAISLLVNCDSQAEIDALWDKLSADGGEESQCGWLKDKYGLSWQIVPARLGEMMQSDDTEKTQRVMEALLKMSKLDIDTLEQAYEQT